MRRRKQYSLAYLLVLLAALAGFFLIRERARAIQAPQIALPSSAQQVITELDLFGLFARLIPGVTPAASPTPSIPLRTPEPVVVQGVEPAATPTAAIAATALAGPMPEQAAASPAGPALPFAPAGAVRSSSDDCPAPSIRGVVRDAAGSPLGGVRLWRYDQLGNEAVVESQSGDAGRGQYEFPFDDTVNVHYVQVIDAGGAIISPVIEIPHRQGDAADALCHWLDWQQRVAPG